MTCSIQGQEKRREPFWIYNIMNTTRMIHCGRVIYHISIQLSNCSEVEALIYYSQSWAAINSHSVSECLTVGTNTDNLHVYFKCEHVTVKLQSFRQVELIGVQCSLMRLLRYDIRENRYTLWLARALELRWKTCQCMKDLTFTSIICLYSIVWARTDCYIMRFRKFDTLLRVNCVKMGQI